jgi:hypothetical protein
LKPQEPGPVKLIVGVLYSDESLLEKGLVLLTDGFGPLDCRSPVFRFDQTDYYTPEMGSPVFRLFVSHERLIHPRDLARIKIETNGMEEKLAVPGGDRRSEIRMGRPADIPDAPIRRKVNFDPGYMDYDKFVLASAKYNGQKVYLDFGIWADLTLHYEKGRFDPYPWSFPDFKSGIYDDVFMKMRLVYKNQRKTTQPE